MSLPVPLAVRVKTLHSDKHITQDVRALKYRSTIPGGFASATFALDRPLNFDTGELDVYGTVYVYDKRDGTIEWMGRLEDPGRGVNADGRIWNISALGPMVHASDRTAPLIYVDRTLDDFIERSTGSAKNGRAESDQDANELPVIKLSFDRGYNANSTSRIGMRYRRILEAGLKLGRFNYAWDSGVTDANWTIEARTKTGVSGTPNVARTNTLNTAGGAGSGRVVVTNWTNGDNVLELVLQSNVGVTTAVPNDVYYVLFGSFSVRQLLLDASGNEITTGYNADSVLASEVVKDLLGRLLPKFDGANASITATSYAIDQLMYENGATPQQVLADLIENFEPSFYWAAWEETSAGGPARFVWNQWPSTVALEATAVDGFDAPGSAADLVNRCHVRWQAAHGRISTTIRTQTVAALDNAGLTRDAYIDLSDELASSANAIRAGDQFLAQHATLPNEGTLRIARPILDLSTGRMLYPWQLPRDAPGKLIRVRDIKPRVDALNPTDRDGVTVFRVYSAEYDSDTGEATLELDSGSKAFRRARTRQGIRRVVAPKPKKEELMTDKQRAAERKAKRKRHHHSRNRRH